MSALLGCVTSVSSLGANPPYLTPPPAVNWPAGRLVNLTRRLKAFSLRKLYRHTVKSCGTLPQSAAETVSAPLWPRGRHWVFITLCLFPAAECCFSPFLFTHFLQPLIFYVPNSRTSLFGIVVFCSRWALSTQHCRGVWSKPSLYSWHHGWMSSRSDWIWKRRVCAVPLPGDRRMTIFLRFFTHLFCLSDLATAVPAWLCLFSVTYHPVLVTFCPAMEAMLSMNFTCCRGVVIFTP